MNFLHILGAGWTLVEAGRAKSLAKQKPPWPTSVCREMAETLCRHRPVAHQASCPLSHF